MTQTHQTQIIDRFNSRQAVIGIVGLGYVGLPLMLRYTGVGFRVLGIDIDPAKVEKLNAGQTYIEHIPSDRIAHAVKAGFAATTDFSRAGEVNTSMPYFVVQRVMDALNEHGKALKNAQVLVLGAAYKKNVDDDRESPSYKLMELLMEKGAVVTYNDPHIPVLRPGRKYDFGLASTPLTRQTLADADCVLIATDHDAYDYPFILEHAPLIVDTRNVYPDPAATAGKVFPA
jgi:UDP-N-acetyl-D-mannosaminuronate dehydrogenase